MLGRAFAFLSEYLRINAIKRVLRVVDVQKSEIALLSLFAVIFAVFEGVGLSMLLPVLQFAEGGQSAVVEGAGGLWLVIARVMDALSLPVTLPVLLSLAFVPILMRQVIFYINTWYSAIVSSRIAHRLRSETLDAFLGADPEFFTRYQVGTLVGVLVTQTNNAGLAILAVIRQLSTTILMVLYVAILMAISVPLTLIALVFAVLVSLVVRANIRRTKDYGLEVAQMSQSMVARIVERIGMIRLIKLRDQKTTESERIKGYSEGMRSIAVKQARLGANIEVTADPLLMLSVFVTLYVGISVQGMSLAQLGLLLFVLTRLNAKVKEFNAGRQAISVNVAGLLLVKEMSADAEASNTIRPGAATFAGLQRELVFNEVRFAYPDSLAEAESGESALVEVLKDVSLTIPSGSFTALVGRSGAGKSTLVELLPRLRDVTGGTITYDGLDVREFDLSSLRKGIGYLTQSPMLFDDTIRANLTYGLDVDASDEDIRDALERAYATFVYDLPKSLETNLGEKGVRLSGGEQQRIALARVLLEDTSLLILDEPTSALDSESEEYIQKALAALHGDKTVIVIAHRLATVMQADQLLVIDDGRIVERGTHAELVAQAGSYHKLFESQLLH